ncbi:hypothetical protein M409DRAFT_20686 [Zasmidium cellare ATCC 36951]|uniref:Uncharacterized protein n=1 Tax=Zasmidium cellare ATCC 36951 TaxID=1080233 RepID=A0A6A6CTI4_ZASCE|nr:uncharacterized protein M409DRAFT_20686 [Zasmidium cellare ATCC 36951]KAF2169470.1 hypothetical protein M409DRAFT_20686 [Zasmidium cellare ATCC 36951]
MASFTKLIALFSLAAAFGAGNPTSNTLAGREATKLDITTKDGQDFALVPVEGNYGKDVTIHLGPLPEELPEVHKREDASVDAVAYNPAYIYAYKGGYPYAN